jgi:hypothetical protein
MAGRIDGVRLAPPGRPAPPVPEHVHIWLNGGACICGQPPWQEFDGWRIRTVDWRLPAEDRPHLSPAVRARLDAIRDAPPRREPGPERFVPHAAGAILPAPDSPFDEVDAALFGLTAWLAGVIVCVAGLIGCAVSAVILSRGGDRARSMS